MKVKIEMTTTCFACGIQTPYEVKEERVMTPQEFINTKLALLSQFSNCSVSSMFQWEKRDGVWNLVAWGTPLINGKYQGCTSIWFTIQF